MLACVIVILSSNGAISKKIHITKKYTIVDVEKCTSPQDTLMFTEAISVSNSMSLITFQRVTASSVVISEKTERFHAMRRCVRRVFLKQTTSLDSYTEFSVKRCYMPPGSSVNLMLFDGRISPEVPKEGTHGNGIINNVKSCTKYDFSPIIQKKVRNA